MIGKKSVWFITFFFSVLYISGCWNPFSPEEKKPDVGIPPSPPYAIDSDPAWSPDGKLIAYCSRDDGGIWLIDSNGENKHFLVNGFAPDWSADGKRIAFNQGWNIFTIKVDGDSLTQLTFDGMSVCPSWSPDGKKIAYTILGEGISIMDSDGSNKTHITRGHNPDWSPEGTRLVYSLSADPRTIVYQIWTIDSNGTNPRKLASFSSTISGLEWSPDGTRIAFSAEGFEGYGLAQGLPALQIWVMNADGSRQRQLTKGGGENPSWSPDSKRIIYNQSTYDGGRLWIMNADGTNKRQFTH